MQFISRYFSLEALASYSAIGLIVIAVIAFNLFTDNPPDEKDLMNVQGEVVVIDPNFAFIKYGDGQVKITYECLCNYGWKEKNLASAKYLQAQVTGSSGKYEAWRLILDDKMILNRMDASGSPALISILALLSLIFIGIIAANKIKLKKLEKFYRGIFEKVMQIEDPELSVDERLAIVEELLASDDDRLLFSFAELGRFNDLPEALQIKVGDALGYFMAKYDDPPELYEDILRSLQPQVKTAALARFENRETIASDEAITNN